MTNTEHIENTNRWENFKERCYDEALKLEATYIEPHHALLALLADENTNANRILEVFGVSYWQVRRMILDMDHTGWAMSSPRVQAAYEHTKDQFNPTTEECRDCNDFDEPEEEEAKAVPFTEEIKPSIARDEAGPPIAPRDEAGPPIAPRRGRRPAYHLAPEESPVANAL